MPDVTVTPTLTISATAPAVPTAGDLWWNSAIGVFFVYYDDGTSTQWVTTQPVKYINIAELQAPAGGDLTGYYPNPSIEDAVALEYPVLKNPLLLSDYSERLASTKWVTDVFASFGLLGQVTQGPGILLTPNPMAGDSTIALRAIDPPLTVPGPYGSANQTAAFEINEYGQIVSIANVAIPPINSPAFTGVPTAPDPGLGSDDTTIPTTRWVKDVLDATIVGTYAPLNSPAFSGTPTAPTAGIPPTTPATQIANTLWVATYFLALTGGTLSGALTINVPAGGTLFSAGGTVNGDVMAALTNTSTGALSQAVLRMGAGSRLADRRVHYTSQYLYDVGSVGGIVNYFSDFDTHTFRTLASGVKLSLSTTIATLGLPLTTTGNARVLNATAIPAGGTQAAGYLLSSTVNFGVIFGSGAPTASMARGSLYLRSDGPPYYNLDGATGWSPIGGNVTVSDTPPVGPLDGQLWWNSVLGSLFINYNDGSTTQWVPASPEVLGNGGKLLQSVSFQTGAMATGTTLIPVDNTIPQITEGNQYMSLAFTPQSPNSQLEIEIVFNGVHSVAGPLTVALFQDAIADALKSVSEVVINTAGVQNFSFRCDLVSGSTTARTYRVHAGGRDAGTTTFNGAAGAAQFGGTLASGIYIREVIAP